MATPLQLLTMLSGTTKPTCLLLNINDHQLAPSESIKKSNPWYNVALTFSPFGTTTTHWKTFAKENSVNMFIWFGGAGRITNNFPKLFDFLGRVLIVPTHSLSGLINLNNSASVCHQYIKQCDNLTPVPFLGPLPGRGDLFVGPRKPQIRKEKEKRKGKKTCLYQSTFSFPAIESIFVIRFQCWQDIICKETKCLLPVTFFYPSDPNTSLPTGDLGVFDLHIILVCDYCIQIHGLVPQSIDHCS